MIRPWSKTRATQHFKSFILPQFSFLSSHASIPLTKSQSCSSGIFLFLKKSFPIPKLFHMCRKEPSARVLILAIRFLGGQTPRTENRLFMALFLGNRVELFRELSSANTHQLKVKLWNGPILYLASLFGNASVLSSFHLHPQDPAPAPNPTSSPSVPSAYL